MRHPAHPALPVASRAVVAAVGGYVAAALSAAALARWLPMPRAEAVMTGMLSSFAVHACIAIMAFAVATALRAWLWLAVVCVPLGLGLYIAMHGVSA